MIIFLYLANQSSMHFVVLTLTPRPELWLSSGIGIHLSKYYMPLVDIDGCMGCIVSGSIFTAMLSANWVAALYWSIAYIQVSYMASRGRMDTTTATPRSTPLIYLLNYERMVRNFSRLDCWRGILLHNSHVPSGKRKPQTITLFWFEYLYEPEIQRRSGDHSSAKSTNWINDESS